MIVDHILEKDILPDFLLRTGIKFLLKNRLKDESNGDEISLRLHQQKLIEELRNSPLAINTMDANEQHYEVPADFFRIVLGPWLKYSSGFWFEDTKSLQRAEEDMLNITIDRAELDGAAILTHDLPCGPEITFPEEDEILDPDDPVVAAWDPVTNKLDNETGECSDETGIEIIGYQIVVDIVDSDPKQRFDIKVPANVTVITVPPEFIAPGSEYTIEVLAIEESGNQTITESGFLTSN